MYNADMISLGCHSIRHTAYSIQYSKIHVVVFRILIEVMEEQ